MKRRFGNDAEFEYIKYSLIELYAVLSGIFMSIASIHEIKKFIKRKGDLDRTAFDYIKYSLIERYAVLDRF